MFGKKIISRMLLAGTAMLVSAHVQAANHYGTPPRCSGTSPTPNEAYVYTKTRTNGSDGDKCYVLSMFANSNNGGDPWVSWDASNGFPNDDIESVKVGSGVRLVLFWNGFQYKDDGQPRRLYAGEDVADLGTWRNQASAARLQTFYPGLCEQAYAVNPYADPNYSGDCTVLPQARGQSGSYNYGLWDNAVVMGFRNDTMSSIKNRGNYNTYLYNDACNSSCSGSRMGLWAFTDYANLGSYAYNDVTSAVCTPFTGNICNY